MNKKEIEYKIRELKFEYVRLQNDLEKLENVKGILSPLEKQLADIEAELHSLNEALRRGDF
ncbi:SE1832 family protein [Neobacillus sp. OS1-2]|uniref:SE1832 family protein n=1 Tax=Neobacillus sp. OS1-2 TaxID=3070680 RepID=UPI0027DF5609|nr:SE1832 family protein [Neobacillus sp. OS1-2]WML38090.1 SE1832 family protein [Neobacillus sp. OS1-2]